MRNYCLGFQGTQNKDVKEVGKWKHEAIFTLVNRMSFSSLFPPALQVECHLNSFLFVLVCFLMPLIWTLNLPLIQSFWACVC